MAKHEADTYQQYRPLYPAQTFDGLLHFLESRQDTSDSPLTLLDVGCGTGQSTQSFRTALASSPNRSVLSIEIQAIDPDPEMIATAQTQCPGASFLTSSAERLPFSAESFDAVMVLSAYHWFDRDRANAEIIRVLKPGGYLLVAEYQFPKSTQNPELNEWIRRGFNQLWRFENQQKRGSLKELTQGLVHSEQIRKSEFSRIPMQQLQNAESLSGLLISQARVIAALHRLPSDGARLEEIRRIQTTLTGFMGSVDHPFEFNLTAVEIWKN